MVKRRERANSSRGQGFMVGAFIALTILTVGQFIDSRLEDQRQREHLERVQDDLTTSLNASTAQTRALIEQVESDGKDPVVDPEEVPDAEDVIENGADQDPRFIPVPGVQGEQGPPPTRAQVEAALLRLCRLENCEPAPTADQVARALVDYCTANGQCEGDKGDQGNTGDQGPSGPEGPQGPQGPPPSAEQVLAAVTSYCSSGACSGTTTVTLANCEPEAGMVVTGIQPSGNASDGYTLTCSKSVDLINGGNGGGEGESP